MALQRTRRPRFSFARASGNEIRSGRSLRSLGAPLNARPLGSTRTKSRPLALYARMLGRSLLTAALVGALSCSSASAARMGDVLGAARDGLLILETQGGIQPVILVLPSGTDRKTKSVLCQMRRCLKPEDVPTSEMFVLPVGYFVLEEFRVQGDEAILAGRFGPIPRQRPGLRIDACGTGVRIPLARQPTGRWVAGPIRVDAC
jgi:hypothetical protein